MVLTVRAPGELTCNSTIYRCALGRAGIGIKSGEGDGITPVGLYPLRSVFFRPDRLPLPKTSLPVSAVQPSDGWCDDPAHPEYNKKILLPFSASHEELWRSDGLYNLVVEIGYNDDPVIAGRGSAIFLHVARPEYEPTEGCVALKQEDLLEVLKVCGPESQIEIIQPDP